VKNDSNLMMIMIVAIVAVVGVVAMLMNNSPVRPAGMEDESLVGEASLISDPPGSGVPTPIKTIVNCTDSDGGINYFKKGTAVSGTGKKTDLCVNTTSIREYYCKNNNILQIYYGCPSGCSNGACINQNNTITCTDSDGGKNYYIKGTCTSTGATAPDICLPDSQNPSVIRLNEKYCGTNGCTNEIYICPIGTSCTDGACKAQTYANETVRCDFMPSYNTTHICSSDKGNCTGINSCEVFVWGMMWENVSWGSDCYGSPITVIDGVNQKIQFNCTL